MATTNSSAQNTNRSRSAMSMPMSAQKLVTGRGSAMSRYSSAWPTGRTPSISVTTTERIESSRRATALG